MACPHCGGDTPPTAGRCGSCNAPIDHVLTVAAGTLTPPPQLDPAAPTVAGTAADVPASGGGASRAGPFSPGSPFGRRYRILRQLGAGGMGVVYQAWDDELGVAVALKVIRPEVVADPYAGRDIERRFKRELLLARQVTHKHVVRIHDLGEVDGIKYLTMPFIEGRDLASLLREAGTLPIDRALRIARQVAAGLQAAHEAGVVHRDLKPENIMIDADEQALIMDFGISRSVGGGGTMTAHGAIVGTLEYMAPEQGRGGHVDHRTDVYAFGLMLRDMLIGRSRLASSESAIAEMMTRMTQGLPPMRQLDPAVPDALDALVGRCIDPDPEKRYQTTADLVAALHGLDAEGRSIPEIRPAARRSRWLVAAAAVLLFAMGAAGSALWWSGRGRGTPAAAREPVSVLIADFENAAGDPVFEGTLEQALGIAMEGAPFISAFQRNTARQIAERRLKRGPRLDLESARLVAHSEGVRIVLAGSIAAHRGGYRLQVRALDVEGKALAAREESAASKADVLRAIGALAAAIRQDLGDTSSQASRLADAETFTSTSLEAVHAFARGNELNRSGKPREALAALEEAIRLDNGFAAAYVHIGSIYTNLKMPEHAKAHYDEAFKHLDRMTEREKYRSLGVYYFDTRNYKEMITTYEKLVELYPADNTGYANLALAYVYDRQTAQAVEMGRKAIEIYPRNLLQRTNYATYSMYSGDFATAMAEAQQVVKENPSYEWAGLTLATATLASGDEPAARARFERLSGVSPLGASLASMGLADLELHRGRPAAALPILEAGIAHDEQEKDSSSLALKLVAAAEAHMVLGNRQAALRAAERASTLSSHEAVLVPAADVLGQFGREERLRQIAKNLQGEIPAHVRSYARVVGGMAALRGGRVPDAITELQGARELHDSWYVHLVMGHAYFAAGKFREAMAQWEECVRRRGEATDVFIADTSSLRYLPPVYYWLARAKEEVGGRAAAAEDYRTYLELRRDAERDPLVADAQARMRP